MERRKYIRLAVNKDFSIKPKGQEFIVGKINDISPCGLSFKYKSSKKTVENFEHIEIYLDHSEFQQYDIPCALVYDCIDSSYNGDGKNCHRCGLHFKKMNDEQKNKLNYFLSNFTTDVKKRQKLYNAALNKLRMARRLFIPLFIDSMLLTAVLIGAQLFKRKSFKLSICYIALFGVFYISWLAIAVAMEKFHRILKQNIVEAVAVIVKSNIVLVYLVSFSVVLFPELSGVSRVQTFGTCVAFLILELAAYAVYALFYKIRIQGHSIQPPVHQSGKISYPLMLIDAGLVLGAFMLMNYIKRGSFVLLLHYDQALLLLYAMWGFSLIYTKKFNPSIFDNDFIYAFNQCIRAILIMSASLGVIIFAGRLFYYSRIQLFGVPAMLLAFEAGIFYLYWLYRRRGRIGMDIETSNGIKAVLDIQDINFDLPAQLNPSAITEPVQIKLKHALEFFDPKLYSFIVQTIDLKVIDRRATALMNTAEIDCFESLANNQHQLLVNLHKTNDVRWFNRYFLQVYRKMQNQGYFIGKVRTIDTHNKYYHDKYPKYLARLLHIINFIWCRVFPKLPVLKKFYFTVTQGRNRIVSKAEIFGRLHFCGFKVVNDLEIDNHMYFIAQKMRMPSYQPNPSYGPLVHLKRIGFNSELITIYKFRTMFPYSEFVQEYIYDKNNLKEGGKFKDDFRITGWGKFMRATWLDELPMIYNWIKGDLKLYGVRPLSRQYLSLYTEDLRKLRTKVLPGLIPPYYADIPKTLEEIIDSEHRYIQSYLQAPIMTQLKYLWRSSINILFKGARSG